MRRMRCIALMVMVLAMGQTWAQGAGMHFKKSNDEKHAQSVTISTKSLFRQSPLISYEHTLAPGKGSVEGSVGWFTSGESNRLQGGLVKAAYKWTFPIGAKAKALSQESYLHGGFYLKQEVSYVYRSRWYESFTYNDGWEMYYDNVKYHDNNAAVMLMMGFQGVWRHFILEYSFGMGRYWSTNAFNQGWTYGYTALGGNNRGLCTFNTLKVGIPF